MGPEYEYQDIISTISDSGSETSVEGRMILPYSKAKKGEYKYTDYLQVNSGPEPKSRQMDRVNQSAPCSDVHSTKDTCGPSQEESDTESETLIPIKEEREEETDPPQTEKEKSFPSKTVKPIGKNHDRSNTPFCENRNLETLVKTAESMGYQVIQKDTVVDLDKCLDVKKSITYIRLPRMRLGTSGKRPEEEVIRLRKLHVKGVDQKRSLEVSKETQIDPKSMR